MFLWSIILSAAVVYKAFCMCIFEYGYRRLILLPYFGLSTAAYVTLTNIKLQTKKVLQFSSPVIPLFFCSVTAKILDVDNLTAAGSLFKIGIPPPLNWIAVQSWFISAMKTNPATFLDKSMKIKKLDWQNNIDKNWATAYKL